MSDDLKENVMDTNIWLRLVFMLLFAVVFAATRVVLVAVIAIQFLWVLFTANRNEKLLSFASQLATFLYQIYRYLSFNTEKRPFPFDDFPSDEALLDDNEAEVAVAAEEAAAEPETAAEAEVVEEKRAAAKRKARKPATDKPGDEAASDDASDVASESGIEADKS
ncbi:DUF4389 domain-containing protein [Mariprofundus sp. KV]|uniref:DUF4389 domain-containing protein n=1 Tax=Mariprofundus sp. KV TaxID=2608715 RepID=UPI0015A0A9B3|nr:DUF4389 domain-containing protein [Mariprofundus sp. KV]NWF36308.1 DUF4389 domain-containing protein [Mariprofundus sp. KV]